VGKLERNGSLGRPRREWKHIIKLNHQEIELWGVKWTNLAWNRATWCGNEHSGTVRCGEV